MTAVMRAADARLNASTMISSSMIESETPMRERGSLRPAPTVSPGRPGQGHRVRCVAVRVLIFAWYPAPAVTVGGHAVHALLLGAIAIRAYELLIPEATSSGARPPRERDVRR